jgi:hypothetical protein
MTMPKAIALLLLSGLIMAAGVALVFLRVEQGRVDATINERNVGARAGDERATPTGSNGFSSGQANRVLTETAATITAIVRTVEAQQTPAAQRTPAPIGGGVAVGQPIEVNGVRYTVHQVADPEPPGFFSTTAGNRRVALEITQEALSGPAPYTFSRFRIRDVDGKEYNWAITNTEPKFESGTLQRGESRRGWISFQVPATVGVDALMLLVPGQAQGVPIVTLR